MDNGTPRLEPERGVYNARRAAALAGVPLSTLNYWARTGIYLPSISLGPRDRLWSWGDLLALRAIDWFRRKKEQPDAGAAQADDGPRASMPRIRQALAQLDCISVSRDQLARALAIARDGRLYLHFGDIAALAAPGRQGAMPDVLELVRPYNGAPDLLEPRPLLRIVPGKLHGEPHVLHTRIPSASIFELFKMGYPADTIQAMYPAATPEALGQAIEFEQALERQQAA